MQRLSRTLIQLNIATRGHHRAADAPWLDIMAPTVEKQAYTKHLIRVYGFESPLEAAFRYTPGLSAMIDLRVRTRSGFIVQDLIRLGLRASRIADIEQRFATFSNVIDALGWMYVVERSTLLHGAVRRYLLQQAPELSEASRYLSAYDGVAGMRWTDLGNALDAVAQVPAAKRQMFRAAHQAFLGLCEWYHDGLTMRSVG